MDYSQYLTIDGSTRFGKPIIKGTQITVGDVLGWLASGVSVEEIVEDFSELSEFQVRACLAYAADREHKFDLKYINR